MKVGLIYEFNVWTVNICSFPKSNTIYVTGHSESTLTMPKQVAGDKSEFTQEIESKTE